MKKILLKKGQNDNIDFLKTVYLKYNQYGHFVL